ncbi:MAG: hypothetical protein LBN02_03085 [Oscillospiraceae bacterium]|jgi:DNA-binding transcriptional regulator/RsmH inhibitor MraZ|nr:hypothetical protein [Oscillospiraceae bacterium]
MLLTHRFENIKVSKNGQFTVPAEARRVLGDSFYITLSLSHDECLVCRRVEDLERDVKLLIKNRKGSRAVRTLTANSKLVTPDPQGRVTIPENLRELRDICDVMDAVGTGDAIELWNPDLYRAHYVEETSYENLAEIGDLLAEIGWEE